jgi:hypothetical protein
MLQIFLWKFSKKFHQIEASYNNGSMGQLHGALLLVQMLSGSYWVITKAALISVAWDEIALCFYRDVVAIIFLILAAFLIHMFFTSYL